MPDSMPTFTLVDVPGAVPLLGHLRAFKTRPLERLSAWWHQHGDALRFRVGPKTLHLLSHPDLAEDILVTQSDRFVKVYDPRRPEGLALVVGNGLVRRQVMCGNDIAALFNRFSTARVSRPWLIG